MFSKIREVSIVPLFLLLLSQSNVFAGSAELIELAADQRKQVQLLAKDYFYIHGDVLAHKAKKSMKSELRAYDENNLKLRKLIQGTEHKNVLSLVQLLEEEFTGFLKAKDFDLKDASAMIVVSEALSEVYDDIVKKEIKKINSDKIRFLESLEQQAMIIEKMAMYYVAYTMGLDDPGTLQSINDAVNGFDKNHQMLLKQKSKIPTAKKDLKKISKTWKTMKDYYTGIEESQLPAMVLITTDRILKSVNNIIKIYIKQEGL